MAQFLDLTGLTRFKNKNDGIYAKKDGYYQNLGAGVADQLSSSVGIEDSAPYNFRTSGDSVDIGDRERVDAIVGGTVAWNQLVGEFVSYTADASGVTVTYNTTTHELTLNGTTTARVTFATYRFPIGSYIAGHVYLFCNGYTTLHPNGTWDICSDNNKYYSLMKASQSGTNVGLTLEATSSGKTYNNVRFVPQLFDLTAMFGSTIADYIYTLESGTAGVGVAWFRKYFPKLYYGYSASTMMSVKTSAHKMVGFNQWDEEWEVGGISGSTGENITQNTTIRSKNYIHIMPSTVYYLNCKKTGIGSPFYVWYYDADKNYLSNSGGYLANTTVTTPSNAHYIRFQLNQAYGTTYKNDICINLHWDGERDGEYEAYQSWNYPLDSDLELRGIPKLDANNKLYYDGDTYAPDGTVTRKYGIVDLGTLNWTLNTGHQFFAQYSPFGLADTKNALVSNGKYNIGQGGYNGVDMSLTIKRTNLWLVDGDYSTESDLKTALSGVYLVYELDEPTTESADPYQQTQIVDDFGTEEFVDAAVEANERDVAIPVGHETFYQNNLKAKLEMAPNSPDGDGVYVVQQSNGENEYIPLVIPTELPTAPTDDGTYVLKITVSGGTVTKAWVEEV